MTFETEVSNVWVEATDKKAAEMIWRVTLYSDDGEPLAEYEHRNLGKAFQRAHNTATFIIAEKKDEADDD